ncbi:hypothetical protein ACHMW5_36155 (plasmid) [Azospirillum melinis]|uniref:hypothetical protein n=1 Tax=Azospirillum melinis TaxID=328839 RepID=UPI003757BD93
MTVDRFLEGRTISLSVSESPDLKRLGLGEAHLGDALVELARHLIAEGAILLYGGDLRDGGFTERLFQLAYRHAHDVSKPVLINPQPWPIHITADWSKLEAAAKAVAPAATMEFLDPRGVPMPPAQRAAELTPIRLTAEDWEAGLTAMRREVARRADAAILVGGKMDGYKGRMPGVVEEAWEAMNAESPVYLVGGFGGAAGSLCEEFGLLGPRTQQSHQSPAATLFSNLTEANLRTGLDGSELRQLAKSRNTDEIVALVLRGLRRLVAPKGADDQRSAWASPG